MVMRQILVVFTIYFLSISCKKSSKSFSGEMTLEDSIKKELAFDDSIKVLATQYYADSLHIYTFIDYNKRSKFHDELKKYRFSNYPDFDSAAFNKLYREQIATQSFYLKPEIPQVLKQRWIPIYKYKGEFYFFIDCEFQTFFELNDSLLFDHYMDGEYPQAIKSYSKNANYDQIEFYNGEKVNFNLVDPKNSIYIVKRDNSCMYYTTIENVNNFAIINQHCHEEMESLIEFEKVNCE